MQHKVKKGVLKNLKMNGGIGYPDVKLKIDAMRVLLFTKIKLRPEKADWVNSFNDTYSALKEFNENVYPIVRCPQLYKDIAILERKLNVKKVDDNNIEILGEMFELNKLKTVCVYNLLVDKAYLNQLSQVQSHWKQVLNNGKIEFEKRYQFNFNKSVDAYTKDLHYLIISNSLYTNNRLSKFTDISLLRLLL